MRTWLQLTRAHTAPLEIIPAVLGALLALEGELAPAVVLWGVFGLLYHLTGYGHNSVADYRKGYDENDPYKQHHPMNSKGLIFEMGASFVITGLLIVTVVYAVLLTFPSIYGLGLIGIMLASGLGYNLYGKETKYKFILISIAHSTVFALPYISLGGDIYNPVFVSAWLFMVIWVIFQIAISGEIKDITTDEDNLLKSLGVRVLNSNHSNPHISVPKKVPNIAAGLRGVMMGLAFLTTLFIGDIFALVIAMLVLSPSVAWIDKLLRTGDYNREGRLQVMSGIEASSLIAFCAMLYPIAGIEICMILVSGSAVWLIALNKIEWGTYLSPKV